LGEEVRPDANATPELDDCPTISEALDALEGHLEGAEFAEEWTIEVHPDPVDPVYDYAESVSIPWTLTPTLQHGLVIEGIGTEEVILDGNSLGLLDGVIIPAMSNVTIRGLAIQNYALRGIVATGVDGCYIEDCTVQQAAFDEISISDCSGSVVGTEAGKVYIAAGVDTSFEVRDCRLTGKLRFYTPEPGDLLVAGNRFVDSGCVEVDGDARGKRALTRRRARIREAWTMREALRIGLEVVGCMVGDVPGAPPQLPVLAGDLNPGLIPVQGWTPHGHHVHRRPRIAR
jgi:hypothetical protein